MKKIAVFGSGNGSNFEAIAEYFKNYRVEITCISDVKDSFIFKRAEKKGIRSFYVPFAQTEEFLKENKFNLIILAGYMRILPENILKQADFINIHPSLLPSFKGKNAIEKAYKYGAKVSGVTIHRVTKNVDEGPILAQVPVFIESQMKLEDFENKIHEIEHKLYPVVIEGLLYGKKVNIAELFAPVISPQKSCTGCKG